MLSATALSTTVLSTTMLSAIVLSAGAAAPAAGGDTAVSAASRTVLASARRRRGFGTSISLEATE
ncbi:hypothetical protein [Actinoplanes sp. NPDC051851]|uniref:hypothetical protein n=1 Tax=Actinoplanes sp. NPDC051851 TaxID=3154753 RepID=UPI00344ADCD8